MPVIGGPVEQHEQAQSEGSDKLVLFVIALVIFHIGAFVSYKWTYIIHNSSQYCDLCLSMAG